MTKRELTARLLDAVSAVESGVRPTDPALPREGSGAVKPAWGSAPENGGPVRLTLVIEGPGDEALRALLRAMADAGLKVTAEADGLAAAAEATPKPPKGGRTVITKRDVIAWKKAGRIPQIPSDAIITAYARDEARRLGIDLPRKK